MAPTRKASSSARQGIAQVAKADAQARKTSKSKTRAKRNGYASSEGVDDRDADDIDSEATYETEDDGSDASSDEMGSDLTEDDYDLAMSDLEIDDMQDRDDREDSPSPEPEPIHDASDDEVMEYIQPLIPAANIPFPPPLANSQSPLRHLTYFSARAASLIHRI